MITPNKHRVDTGHRFMRDLLLNQRGSIVIMVVVTIAALLAFAVIAIDGAILMTSKTQLQAAADAAALAGASGLLWGSEDLATERAMNFSSFNIAVQANQTPVLITTGDVTFPEPDICRVQTHRTDGTGDALRTYFLRAIGGGGTANMTAVAAARAYDVCSSKCMKPWAIPDRWNDANGNGEFDAGDSYDKDVTGYNAPMDVGAQITLKVGNPHQTIAPGIYYPVDYPPLDNEDGIKPLTGGSWYQTWIAECEPYMIEPGDRLQLEPGNMVGPTMHGMEDLIALDPSARWDSGTNSIVGSAFGKSPRIGLVPFFDPTLPPTSGRNYVTVAKIGAFFIENTTSGGGVTGRFIQITEAGVPCGTGVSNSFVKGIVLIQ
jgi:Flp pilus assembly protein TadG